MSDLAHIEMRWNSGPTIQGSYSVSVQEAVGTDFGFLSVQSGIYRVQ